VGGWLCPTFLAKDAKHCAYYHLVQLYALAVLRCLGVQGPILSKAIIRDPLARCVSAWNWIRTAALHPYLSLTYNRSFSSIYALW
jgi:hypothetical protein